MSDQNAFDTLNARDNQEVHRITPGVRVEGTGDNSVLTLTLPIIEIAKSRKGPNRRGALGFLFGPIDFEHDGKKYRLYPGWTSLTRR
jgi:hypothetical protein